MDNEEITTIPDQKPVRPTMLTVLCILTFIGSGMNLFSSIFIASFFDLFLSVMEELSEQFNFPGLEMLAGATPLFFLVTAFLYAGSIGGAILMMRLKKAGFHLYTISQILLIIAPMIFLHLAGPGFLDIMVLGVFVILYATNLKFMS